MSIYERMTQSHPQLVRGTVWCRSCGAENQVNTVDCLRNGWPKCCGHTMTIDHLDTWEPSHE